MSIYKAILHLKIVNLRARALQFIWKAIIFVAVCSGNSLTANPLLSISQVEVENYPQLKLGFAIRNPHPQKLPPEKLGGFELFESYGGQDWKLDLISGGNIKSSADRLNLLLVIDSTESIPQEEFETYIEASKKLVERLSPEDRVAVYTINGETLLRSGFTGDKEKLQQRISAIKREGRVTHLYDALHTSLLAAQSIAEPVEDKNKVAGDSQNTEEARVSRTAVILFTDGRDENSFISDEDLMALSRLGRSREIAVYTYLFGDAANEKNLVRLARLTGGRVYHDADPETVDAMLGEITLLSRQIFYFNATSQAVKHSELFPGDRVSLQVNWNSELAEEVVEFEYVVPWEGFIYYHLRRLPVKADPRHIAMVLGLSLLAVCLALFCLLIFALSRRRRNREHSDYQANGTPGRYIMPLNYEGLIETPVDEHGIGTEVNAEEVFDEERLALGLDTSTAIDEYRDRESFRFLEHTNRRVLELALHNAPDYSKAALVVMEKTSGQPGEKYTLISERTVIGSGKWAHIRLLDNEVSAVHARIRRVNNSYIMFDMLSGAGVYLNGHKLLRPRALSSGDEIRLGQTAIIFHGEN